LGQVTPPFRQALFNYLRYDVKLEQEWLASNLGVNLDTKTISNFRRLDAAENISKIFDLGVQAAELQIQRKHLEVAYNR